MIKYMTEEEQDEFWRKHSESKEKLLERQSFGLGELPDDACNFLYMEVKDDKVVS